MGLLLIYYTFHTDYKDLSDAYSTLYGLPQFCKTSDWLYTYECITSNCGFNSFVFALLVLYLKKDEDVFSGINKLDNLLKVSIFQECKIPGDDQMLFETDRVTTRNWKPRSVNGTSLYSTDLNAFVLSSEIQDKPSFTYINED